MPLGAIPADETFVGHADTTEPLNDAEDFDDTGLISDLIVDADDQWL